VLRLPATRARSLICFVSGVHPTLLGSCLAACAPGRSEGAFRAGVIVQPATRIAGLLSRGRERDLPGSQAIHPVPLPRSTTPTEPTIPRLSDGFVDAAPTLPTARASAVDEFRGSIARLQHPLPTLQEWCCRHPCKASGWLARRCREGVEPSGSLQKVSDHILVPLFSIYPGARVVSWVSPQKWRSAICMCRLLQTPIAEAAQNQVD
jgi:hypothetical protein